MKNNLTPTLGVRQLIAPKRPRLASLCASLLIVVLAGCQTLAGPKIIPLYRVVTYETGVIDTRIEGRRDLRIQHEKLHELSVYASPAIPALSRAANIELRFTPKDGVKFQIAGDEFRIRGCEDKDWSVAHFRRLTGGGSSNPRPILDAIEGGRIMSRGELVNAPYVVLGDLPKPFSCFYVDLPLLLVDGANLRVGEIQFQLGEIRSWAYST